MTEPPNDSSDSLEIWEGSNVFVEQGRHWSSAFIWLSSSLFAFTLLWAFTAKVDQTISVRGELDPAQSTRDVDSPATGVVSNVYVTEGQFVDSGSPLITINSTALTSRKDAIENRIKLLELEIRALESIISTSNVPYRTEGLPSSFPSIPDSDDPSLRSKFIAARDQTIRIQTQLNQLGIRLQSRKESLNLQTKIADDLTLLFNGGGLSRNAYLERLNNLQILKAEIASLEGEYSQILGSASSQLNSLNRQLIAASAELSSAEEALSFRVVSAPTSGVIFDLKVSETSVLSSSQKILSIVPPGSLNASVKISNKDIGFVRVGQSASVSVDSFPSGEFGYIPGKILHLGSDALPPDSDSPFTYFPATISLSQQSVVSGSSKLNLQSGMGVTANIKLRSRPAISIITDLFTKQLDGIKQFR